jgi:hypothetical protein
MRFWFTPVAYRVTEQIVNCGGMLSVGKNSWVVGLAAVPLMYARGPEAPYAAPVVSPGVIALFASPEDTVFRLLPLWSINTLLTSSHRRAV